MASMASMASGRCALFLGPARSCNLAARLPLDPGARSVRISCKIRWKKISSQHRRQQAKRLSPLKLVQENMDFESSDSGSEQVPKVVKDRTVDTAQDTSSFVTKREELPPAAGEKLMQIENADEGQPLQRVPLVDLIDTIKNAEKNILLLNQARILALKNLDKIISEKEALQAQLNVLEMKLAETDVGNRFAAQEKVKVELLEDQFEKLKTDVSSGNSTVRRNFGAYENGTDIKNPDFLLSDVDSPQNEELTALRKENMSLMNDIQTLTAKLPHVEQTEERMLMLEKEKSLLEAAVKELEFGLAVAQEDVLKRNIVKDECEELKKEVENLQALLDNASQQANEAVRILEQNRKLQNKVDELEASLEVSNASKVSEKSRESTEELRYRVKMLEEQLQVSDQEIKSYIQLYQEAVKEFHIAIAKHEEEDNREPIDDMPWEFWSRLLLTIDGWLLEKKISSDTAKSLKEMAWKKDGRIRDAYLACSGKDEQEVVGTFVTLASPTRSGFHIIHIAAEMAPVAKVGGLGDVVSGLSKALQRKGHLVEIILPKYDFMQYESIADLRALDVELQSYFDGHLFQNTIWVGTVEGLPVYFVDSHHPAKFFSRGQLYGEHDDFKRFSYFSRAALELIHQAGKRPDIIHCHDWQTAFIAPLYWDLYAIRGLNSARICFTCHNFEYQGTTVASELSSCGLDVHRLNRPDRMQDHSAHDRVNPVKGAIVFSNIVTTVSPTYAEEVRTAEGGWGLHETLKPHTRKFLGILNGIDTDVWNPSSDPFLRVQFAAHDLQGKAENKKFLQEQLKLSSADASQPLVGCITRLVPQKGVHLIRHAIYKTVELGGQFLLLGSSPVPHIQSEFESIADHFRSSPHVRLILKYDEALSRLIFAASDMFIVPSIFEPCGLTQMIAMRYGSIPIVRRTGGLNDSVFDLDDETIPIAVRNGFTFLRPDEQALNGAMERAFKYYKERPEMWQQLVQKVMKMDFSWDSSAAEYEAVYENAVVRAREAAAANHV